MSALSPEAYEEVFREIQSRAPSYNGQLGADVDWLLMQYRSLQRQRDEAEQTAGRFIAREHRLANRVQQLEELVYRVTPENMGGYPDLFFPKGGWEQFQADVDALIPPIQRPV